MTDGTFASPAAVSKPLTLDELRETAAVLECWAKRPPVQVVRAETSRHLIDVLAEALRRSGLELLGVYPEPALRPGAALIDHTWAEPRLYLCDDDLELLIASVSFDSWMRREESRLTDAELATETTLAWLESLDFGPLPEALE